MEMRAGGNSGVLLRSQFSSASLRCDPLSLCAVDPCVVRRITSAKYKLERVVGDG